MEETDRRIVSLLADDGRMSFTDLGKATGLSTSAVHQRVKRLEQRGLIRGYTATIDHDQMGRPLTAFVSITPIARPRNNRGVILCTMSFVVIGLFLLPF